MIFVALNDVLHCTFIMFGSDGFPIDFGAYPDDSSIMFI